MTESWKKYEPRYEKHGNKQKISNEKERTVLRLLCIFCNYCNLLRPIYKAYTKFIINGSLLILNFPQTRKTSQNFHHHLIYKISIEYDSLNSCQNFTYNFPHKLLCCIPINLYTRLSQLSLSLVQ